MKKIHVGILVSYDYQYAPTCIRHLYEYADRITLAIDINRRTWSGGTYTIDEGFWQELEAIDKDHKIQVYEDDFCVPGLTAMENDTRERNMLAGHMGPADDQWHVQVDADEYFLDFGAFVAYLHSLERKFRRKPVTVWGEMIPLFKKEKDGFLYIDNPARKERVSLATNDPRYDSARVQNDTKITQIHSDHLLLHQSWARDEAEIREKLANWGHKTDFDVASYFNFWKSTDRHNAPFIRDFHPLPNGRKTWRRLTFIPGGIDEMTVAMREGYHPTERLTCKQYLRAKLKPELIKSRCVKLLPKPVTRRIKKMLLR